MTLEGYVLLNGRMTCALWKTWK